MMRSQILATTLLAASLASAQVHASKCNQVADDHYKLLVLGVVEDKRAFVRDRYCPVRWDAKKQIWYGTASAIKTCLRQSVPVLADGKPRSGRVDSDPDPRAAHFVFSVVNSSQQTAWLDFGKLVDVDLPAPAKAAGPVLASTGVLLLHIEPSAPAAAAAFTAGSKADAAAIALRSAQAAEHARMEMVAAVSARSAWVGRNIRTYSAANLELYGKVYDWLWQIKGLTPAEEAVYSPKVREAAKTAAAARGAANTAAKATAAARSATAIGVAESLAAAIWPMAAAELIAWSITYGLDNSCAGKWYDERKKLLDAHFKNGGSISYSFRVNTGGMPKDNYVEQTVLAHLKGEGAPRMFPLMQDRRPLEFR